MTGLIRVDDVVFDQAVENMIRLTGAGSMRAQWLVQAVLAPALLAPKALMLAEPDDGYIPADDLGPIPGEDCPYGYLRSTGEVVRCSGPDPKAAPGEHHYRSDHPEGGWHEGPPGTVIWHEDDPRSVHILQWRGDTA